MKTPIYVLMILFAFTVTGMAAESCQSCSDDCSCGPVCGCEHPPRAPAGVMGDHSHHKGGWMVSYRYMAMHMEGLRDDDSTIIGGMSRPLEMDMQMHMIGAMYAPVDRFTLALMVPYVIKDMDMLMMGTPTSIHTEGVGDVKLAGIYDLWSSSVQQVLLNLAVSLPTGSIDEENATGNRLAYPMQLGSGSYGLVPGVTYAGFSSGWGWGAQAKATIPLNENKYDYTLGNRYDLQGWLLRDLCRSSAVSLRLNGWHRENIDGADPTLITNPTMSSPGHDPDLRAATRIDLLAGIDYRKGVVRLAIEGGVPVYQHLDGPQLEAEWMAFGSAQFSF